MATNIITLLNANIQKIMKGEVSPSLLHETAGIALDLPPALPLWFESTVYKNSVDLDMMLCSLSKYINTVYNDDKVFLFAPEVFLAKMGYKAVCGDFTCCLFSGLKKEQDSLADARAVFVSVLPYEQPDILFHSKNAILLNPGRFNSLQLKTVTGCMGNGASVTLWESDNVKRSLLALTVRRNDKEKLDFLLARWGIEKPGEEKDKQLEFIINFMEAMAEWVEHGKQ